MFPRLGMFLLAQQMQQTQRVRASRCRECPTAAQDVSYSKELGMLLRLGTIVAVGTGLVALVMSISA